jgi:hypothetical protein
MERGVTTMKLENVHIRYNSHHMVAIGWNVGPDKYHIWMYDSVFDPTGTLYKNRDNAGLKTYDPGYYKTRRLDATNKNNAAMIAEAKRIVDAGDLLNLARIEFENAEAAANAMMNAKADRIKLAKEIFRNIKKILSGETVISGPHDHYVLDREDMEALLEFAPSDLT